MKKLFVINACFRENSRTKILLDFTLNLLKDKYEIQIVDLNSLNLKSVDKVELENRFNNKYEDIDLKLSKELANSDDILIAAPFWDMSFPSILKVFLERLSILNITFKNGETKCEGLCKAKNMFYLTTRGMNIKTGSKNEQATSYLKALCNLWGIKKFKCFACENLDYVSQDMIDKKLNTTKEKIEKYCRRI